MSSEIDPVESEAVYAAEAVASVGDMGSSPAVPTLEIAAAPVPTKPRIWPALLVGIFTLPVGFVVSAVVFAIAMFAELGLGFIANPGIVQPWVSQFMESRIGFLVLVLPGQFVFLGVAFASAWFSPVGWRNRLRLVEGRMPMWTWLVLAIGTPAIGIFSSLLMSLVFEDMGEQLELLQKIFRSHHGAFVAVLVASVAILPGLSEEALFRGYVQSRLLQRLPPMMAITISTLLFSIAHVDPKHVLAVIPLGFWLGIIAWRCDSIWPSAICHMVNNAVAIMMTYASDSQDFGFEADAPTIILLILSVVALIPSVVILIIYGKGRPENVTPPAGDDATLAVK